MRCAAITRAGERCKLEATHGSYCWSHSPQTEEQRRRRARRGGKAGGNGRRGVGEIKDLKRQLQDLAAEVLSGELDKGAAAVVNQILNTRARLIEIERRLKETEELEARLEALESVLKSRRAG